MALHRLNELQNYAIWAADGEIGSLEEAYFDDSTWTVRYLVVNSSEHLDKDRVLVSSVAIGTIDVQKQDVSVEISRSQLQGSPILPRGEGVSRKYEADYYRYFGWPPYWESRSASGRSPSPAEPNSHSAANAQGNESGDRLRNSAEVAGYRISAEDDEIGRAVDFVFDDKKWNICYFEIDTGRLLPGKRVLLNPAWIKEIDWRSKNVVVDLRADDIRSAPAYDPNIDITRRYEIELFEHYAKRKYWE